MSCSCATPPTVNLSDAYTQRNEDNSAREAEQLKVNLKTFGWSILELDTELFDHADCNDYNWKRRVASLFQNQYTCASSEDLRKTGLVYRQAESGAPGSCVEPKESWEIKRQFILRTRSASALSQNISYVENCMVDFIQVLHNVAVTVRRSIGLPCGTLLQEDSEKENIDLLRAFCYHTIGSGRETMGSSPHSDWGSFTVVWQDIVGGLETFCRSCRSWKPVLVTERLQQNKSRLHFVVHLSDMSSLAMALASQRADRNFAAQTLIATHVQPWPSPIHRVLSPASHERVSLVYFAYPPPQTSIDRIADELVSWAKENNGDSGAHQIDQQAYYLLRNQCAEESESERLLHEVTSEPVGQVIEAKWKQVQR